VVFDDGSEFACDAIVACTGYRNAFPIFLDPQHADEAVAGASGGITYKELARELTNPRLLYKQCLHPAFPDGSLAVMGFARPAFGSIPPCSEMQVGGGQARGTPRGTPRTLCCPFWPPLS
jgi:hypothetical protein